MTRQAALSNLYSFMEYRGICILLWSIEGCVTIAAFKFEQVPLDHFYYDNLVWTLGNSWENLVRNRKSLYVLGKCSRRC